jgi:hypothetical protein
VVRDLAEREFAKMSGERGYRPPVAVLRKIAASDVHLDLRDDAPDLYFEESYLEPIGRGVTESIARERVTSRSAAVERLSRRITDALGLAGAPMTEAERRGFGQFAPILAQIPDLDEWNRAEKLALAELCRLRWADTELGFLTAMRRHPRLRTALAEAARRRLQANGGGRGERER